jgi:hypothetical protein
MTEDFVTIVLRWVVYVSRLSLQDLSKAKPDDIFSMACEKLHPQLNRAFQDAGTPCPSMGIVAGDSAGWPPVATVLETKRQHLLNQLP